MCWASQSFRQSNWKKNFFLPDNEYHYFLASYIYSPFYLIAPALLDWYVLYELAHKLQRIMNAKSSRKMEAELVHFASFFSEFQNGRKFKIEDTEH